MARWMAQLAPQHERKGKPPYGPAPPEPEFAGLHNFLLFILAMSPVLDPARRIELELDI